MHFFMMIVVALGASAQAIQSINEKNMKFEKGVKPDPIKVKPTVDMSIPVDTSTIYFALIDSAQNCIDKKQWNRAESFFLDAIKS